VPVTYEMEMTVPCVAPLAFISGESNSIARTPGDPVLCALPLRQNVIGYAMNY